MKQSAAWCMLCVIALLAAPATAHKVGCFAAAEGDRIAGYAWLGGGHRAVNVPFEVRDPDGTLLHHGTTDANGEFSFVPTAARELEITVRAGEGHIAKFTIPANELPARTEGAATAPTASSVPDETTLPGPAVRTPDESELEQTIRRAVSREIAPLRRELAAFGARQRLQDVIAGLGYIAGLAGLAFFFLGRRRRPSPPGKDSD